MYIYSGNRIIAHGPDMTSQCTHFQACVCTGLAAADACTRSEEDKNARVKDIGHIEISMLKSEIIQCFFATKSLYLYIYICTNNQSYASNALWKSTYIHVSRINVYIYICIYDPMEGVRIYIYIYIIYIECFSIS